MCKAEKSWKDRRHRRTQVRLPLRVWPLTKKYRQWLSKGEGKKKQLNYCGFLKSYFHYNRCHTLLLLTVWRLIMKFYSYLNSILSPSCISYLSNSVFSFPFTVIVTEDPNDIKSLPKILKKLPSVVLSFVTRPGNSR